MTMGHQATQNLYNESLGWEVLESCPVFKTLMRETTTKPTHILFQDFTPIKRYTNNIGKLNL